MKSWHVIRKEIQRGVSLAAAIVAPLVGVLVVAVVVAGCAHHVRAELAIDSKTQKESCNEKK